MTASSPRLCSPRRDRCVGGQPDALRRIPIQEMPSSRRRWQIRLGSPLRPEGGERRACCSSPRSSPCSFSMGNGSVASSQTALIWVRTRRRALLLVGDCVQLFSARIGLDRHGSPNHLPTSKVTAGLVPVTTDASTRMALQMAAALAAAFVVGRNLLARPLDLGACSRRSSSAAVPVVAATSSSRVSSVPLGSNWHPRRRGDRRAVRPRNCRCSGAHLLGARRRHVAPPDQLCVLGRLRNGRDLTAL